MENTQLYQECKKSSNLFNTLFHNIFHTDCCHWTKPYLRSFAFISCLWIKKNKIKVILIFLVYSVIARWVLVQQCRLHALNFSSCYLQTLLQTEPTEDSQWKALHSSLIRWLTELGSGSGMVSGFISSDIFWLMLVNPMPELKVLTELTRWDREWEPILHYYWWFICRMPAKHQFYFICQSFCCSMLQFCMSWLQWLKKFFSEWVDSQD